MKRLITLTTFSQTPQNFPASAVNKTAATTTRARRNFILQYCRIIVHSQKFDTYRFMCKDLKKVKW